MSLVDTREIATAKIVMLGGTGGSNVEGNPAGSATEYLSKLQIDDTIFETAGVIPFDVTLINNSDIHISAVNAGQLDGKTILINTTTHTGTTPAGWFLKINQSTSYEMITPEGRSFKDAVSDNMAMIVRLDASQAEATVLGVLGADSSDVVSGLGIGKKTSVSNNVIITDIDLHRAPMVGDRLLIWFDASVQNPTGLTTYNNGTAVTSNLENVSPLNYNAGWNIVQFMNDGLLYNNVWVRKQNVPLPINTLSGLSDTAIASPSDGQLLTYDNDSQKWKNKTYVEANTGFPVTELKKLKVGNVVYDTDGMKNYSVTNVASNNITVSVLNSNQFVQEVIAINTGNHTGSSNAWNLVLNDGMNPVSVALKNADGSPFADDIHENELLFVYVDTAGNVARVLEIHSHDLEILKDAIITEKTVSGNPITITDALPYNAVSLSAEIEAVQDLHGYDHPWVGGAGKNKFDVDTVLASFTRADNKYVGTPSQVVNNYVINGGFKANTQYTLQYRAHNNTSTSSNFRFVFIYTDNTSDAVGYVTTTSEELITGTSASGKTISKIMRDYGDNVKFTIYDIQLEEGSTATSYAPYANICPISGRTAVAVDDTGDNLIDPSAIQSGGIDAGGHEISVSGFSRTGYTPVNDTIFALIGSTAVGYTVRVHGYNASKQWVEQIDYFNSGAMNKVYTVPNGIAYIRVSYPTNGADFILSQGHNVTIQLGTTVYGGTLNVTTGVMTITHAVVDGGDLDWNYWQLDMFYASKSDKTALTESDIKCSAYATLDGNYFIRCYTANENQRKNIYINNPSLAHDATGAAALKNAITGQQIYYRLATPTTIQLTPTDLQMLKGYNRLSSDGGGDLALTYKADRLAAIEAAL